MSHFIYQAILYTAAVPGLLFPLLYQCTSRGAWKRSAVGRSVMALGVAISLVFISRIIGIFVPDEYKYVLRIPVMLAAMIALWGQSLLMVRIWIRNHKTRAAQRDTKNREVVG